MTIIINLLIIHFVYLLLVVAGLVITRPKATSSARYVEIDVRHSGAGSPPKDAKVSKIRMDETLLYKAGEPADTRIDPNQLILIDGDSLKTRGIAPGDLLNYETIQIDDLSLRDIIILKVTEEQGFAGSLKAREFHGIDRENNRLLTGTYDRNGTLVISQNHGIEQLLGRLWCKISKGSWSRMAS